MQGDQSVTAAIKAVELTRVHFYAKSRAIRELEFEVADFHGLGNDVVDQELGAK